MSKSIEDQFEEVCDRIETEFRGDVQILANKDYRGRWHIDVQEVEDPDDPEDEGGVEEGWSTIRVGIFDGLEEATNWLNNYY